MCWGRFWNSLRIQSLLLLQPGTEECCCPMGDSWEVNITYLIRVGKGKVVLTVGALRRLSASQWGHCCKKGRQFAQKCKGFLRPFVKIKMGRAHLFVVSSVVIAFHMLYFILIMYETLYPALLGLNMLVEILCLNDMGQIWVQINNKEKYMLSGGLMIIL